MSDTIETVVTDGPVKSRKGRRALAFVLVMLLVLLGLSAFLLLRLLAPAGAPTGDAIAGAGDDSSVTWVRSIYGMSDAPSDQLSRVQAVTTAADGSLWLTDSIHRSLMHFTADGRFINQLRGPSDVPLDAPSRFTIGPDGRMYVVETAAGAIRVIRSDNTDAGSFGVPQPLSVAVSDDRIVVGSVSGFAIADKKGDPIKVIGTRGKGDDQFDYVHGVAIGADGTIFVADAYNNRLSAYTPAGKRLWMVRTGAPSNSAEMVKGSLAVTAAPDAALSADDALQLPLGLTIDGAGRLVVADMFDCTLAVFDPKDGSFIGKYGEAGGDDGQFFYPVSVSYDPAHDWFTVADSLSDRAQIVRIPGSAPGGSAAAVATVNRTLAGPMRAFVLPLALLLFAGLVALVTRFIRRRRKGSPKLAADPSK